MGRKNGNSFKSFFNSVVLDGEAGSDRGKNIVIAFTHKREKRREAKMTITVMVITVVMTMTVMKNGYADDNNNNKKVLRERKRHTARCVANTPYVVLTGYPPRGGTQSGTPRGVQVPPRGDPGTPPGGGPGQVPPRGGGYPDPPSPPPLWTDKHL